jgi:ATP-dependent exoDNAse (exonuclease V) beta subunit
VEQLSLSYEQSPPQPAAGPRLTAEQQEAVRRRGEPILLSAAAGSGKTSVLVERFVAAVCEDGVPPAAVLAITFTDRAAGELRERVRARLLERGERAAARDTEAASVGTFHAFCGRLLRAHPLPAGLDPDFRVLDATASARLRREAFEGALTGFAASGAPAVDLLAAYGVDLVRATVEAIYAQLRSRGDLLPRLPVREPAAGADAEEADALRAVAVYDDLLARFGESYAGLKRERAAIDFDDLELAAGDLLAANGALRESWSQRFELLMVDEFQDTNPRQLAILHALERGNLFTVGDELQAIYGFRHADVRLFAERRAQLGPAGRALALQSNFRSRPEVLAAVNTVFAERFADFTPLVHGREENEGAAGAGPFVELLLTSPTETWKGHEAAEAISEGLPYAPLARQAEARLLAQRVRELVDSGAARPDEVAVLLRATGDIETFERALQLQGLRTLASVGTFWSRQQIEDLHSYLRALANPRDEEALYAALASPLAGCSRDALSLVAVAARSDGGTLWETLQALAEAAGGDLPGPDRALLCEFVAWFAGERAQAGGRGISELLERAISQRGYDRFVLGQDWAERRLANVHKLLRLARRFEEQEGRDLRGFVDLVAHLKESGASEPEAPVEGVEPDTVQLMTIHAAKGLEFPVVCVADLGRRPPNPADRLFVDGGRVGLRLRRPGEGESTKTLDYEELRTEQRAREREEEDRVFYVALTRARERLVLSGVADFGDWPEEGRGTPPVNWLAVELCPRLPELGRSGPGVLTVAAEEGAPELRLTLSAPGAYREVLRPPGAAPAPGAAAPAGPPAGGPTGTVAEPSRPAPRVAAAPLPPTLSYTSLSLLERCGYRYYLERVLRMPEEQRAAGAPAAGALPARERGTLVHRVLETLEFGSDEAPGVERIAAAAAELGLRAGEQELEGIAALIAGALASPLAARIAASRSVRAEHPFAFGIGPEAPLVTGVIDALCEETDGTVLVVDYKSDRIEPGTDPEALVERDYGAQRLLYALAMLREGALVVEVAHWFLERPAEPALARYTVAERAALEEELAGRLRADWQDPFAVSPRPHRGLCLTCPGRGGMCSWSEEETMREDAGPPAETPQR